MTQDQQPSITTSISDSVATVKINRAHKKNAISLAMWRQLDELFQALDDDSAVRVIILAGSGGSFSAGADISEFPHVRSTPEQAESYEQAVDSALAAIAAVSKPTVAAVSGICFGGGVALAASADFRIADGSASFSISAVHMGLVYNIEKCTRLYQLVGLTNAKRFLLTGDRFTADQARHLGFVDEIADNSALADAQALAAELCRGAPLALDGIKAILAALGSSRIDACRADLQGRINRANVSHDHQEAVRAFAEKRRPIFVGR